MTVKDMIEMLEKQPRDAVVHAWDADSEDYQPVTGVLLRSGTTRQLELQTDDID